MKQILLIDDDMDAKTFIMLALCRIEARFECIHVNRVTEAFRVCKSRLPEIIFLDYQMPGFNGIDFLKQYRALFPENNTPIIFYSSLLNSDLVQQALSLGVKKVLPRPGSVTSIARLITEYQ